MPFVPGNAMLGMEPRRHTFTSILSQSVSAMRLKAAACCMAVCNSALGLIAEKDSLYIATLNHILYYMNKYH